jgi:hypothetical protein
VSGLEGVVFVSESIGAEKAHAMSFDIDKTLTIHAEVSAAGEPKIERDERAEFAIKAWRSSFGACDL